MSSFFEDIYPLFFKGKFDMLSATFYHQLSLSVSTASCTSTGSEACRDDPAALTLKLIAIGTILVSGITGIGIPLIGKNRRFLGTDSNLFVATKAFAAGVILATGFVHMLPDGSSNLSNPCLPAYPWSKFPFAGFCAMVSALLTLVADFVGTQYYERKQKRGKKGALGAGSGDEHGRDGSLDSVSESGIMPVDRGALVVAKEKYVGWKRDRVFGEEEDGGLPVVGMHAHSAEHRHSHPPPGGGDKKENEAAGVVVDVDGEEDDGHGHGHGHSHGFGGGEDGGGRHAVVSQVLELGIVSHSVIIGLSLGVSHSPCTIRPLIAALSFHQFFEGFALGGCISQAQFKTTSTVVMACFFALTTPSGIAAGIGLASFYNPSSARALAIEGILDSVSAGILIYMSLVDLIAADFMSKKMRCNIRLQIVSYFALFFGATVMSSLAIWT